MVNTSLENKPPQFCTLKERIISDPQRFGWSHSPIREHISLEKIDGFLTLPIISSKTRFVCYLPIHKGKPILEEDYVFDTLREIASTIDTHDPDVVDYCRSHHDLLSTYIYPVDEFTSVNYGKSSAITRDGPIRAIVVSAHNGILSIDAVLHEYAHILTFSRKVSGVFAEYLATQFQYRWCNFLPTDRLDNTPPDTQSIQLFTPSSDKITASGSFHRVFRAIDRVRDMKSKILEIINPNHLPTTVGDLVQIWNHISPIDTPDVPLIYGIISNGVRPYFSIILENILKKHNIPDDIFLKRIAMTTIEDSRDVTNQTTEYLTNNEKFFLLTYGDTPLTLVNKTIDRFSITTPISRFAQIADIDEQTTLDIFHQSFIDFLKYT